MKKLISTFIFSFLLIGVSYAVFTDGDQSGRKDNVDGYLTYGQNSTNLTRGVFNQGSTTMIGSTRFGSVTFAWLSPVC